jgi:excisionase family DNA binding protein
VAESLPKLAVKLKEAAAMLSISESTLRRKIAQREIPVSRATRHIVISVKELERFLAKTTAKL